MKETFFTTIGCMDGRSNKKAIEFGREIFNAQFADTITEPGMVEKLGNPLPDLVVANRVQHDLTISLHLHGSKGVIVHGHEECAGCPGCTPEEQKDMIKQAARYVEGIIYDRKVEVIPVFVYRKDDGWDIERLEG